MVLALGFGSLIGLEREEKRKPAGLKTHMLVSLGAACYTLLALEYYNDLVEGHQQTNADPLRLIDGVAGGIGFIGAGAIIQARLAVQGVTTASSIWMVGAIGARWGSSATQSAAPSRTVLTPIPSRKAA